MVKKHAPKRKDKLVHISEIDEEMRLIEGSDTDYITPSAKVYKDYGDGYFYPKKAHRNKHNDYIYVNITFSDGVNRNRRLHVLLAKAYINNPDPICFKYVGHKDNIKWNCTIDNLYWTNNKENIEKAVEDGLMINNIAEDDSQSDYVRVIDKDTNEVVGIYGSLGQCARCIDNITVSFISKMYKKIGYKPRSRRYIYQVSNKDEFDYYKDVQNKHLIESEKVNKNPKVFRMINKKIGYDNILDNQTKASEICGIHQAEISFLIKNKKSKYGWEFEYIDEIEYVDSSCYMNFINTTDDVSIKNINTGEILNFKCKQHMLDYFGLTGHDTSAYFEKEHLIMNEWIVIQKTLEKRNCPV